MKLTLRNFAILALALFAFGCARFPVATRNVSVPQNLKPGDVIEIVIQAARDVNFPPATKIDKQDGLVEFGAFGMPELGITAQVRIKPGGELEINVKKGSMYVARNVDKQTDEFRAKIEERLKTASQGRN